MLSVDKFKNVISEVPPDFLLNAEFHVNPEDLEDFIGLEATLISPDIELLTIKPFGIPIVSDEQIRVGTIGVMVRFIY